MAMPLTLLLQDRGKDFDVPFIRIMSARSLYHPRLPNQVRFISNLARRTTTILSLQYRFFSMTTVSTCFALSASKRSNEVILFRKSASD